MHGILHRLAGMGDFREAVMCELCDSTKYLDGVMNAMRMFGLFSSFLTQLRLHAFQPEMQC